MKICSYSKDNKHEHFQIILLPTVNIKPLIMSALCNYFRTIDNIDNVAHKSIPMSFLDKRFIRACNHAMSFPNESNDYFLQHARYIAFLNKFYRTYYRNNDGTLWQVIKWLSKLPRYYLSTDRYVYVHIYVQWIASSRKRCFTFFRLTMRNVESFTVAAFSNACAGIASSHCRKTESSNRLPSVQ